MCSRGDCPLEQSDLLQRADHFLKKCSREHGRTIRRISTTAIDMPVGYHWPGNVRELTNAIERAVAVCDGYVIHAHDPPPTLQPAEASGTVTHLALSGAMAAYKKEQWQDALKSAHGVRVKAARMVGSTDRSFNAKVRNHGIDWRRFKNRLGSGSR